MALEIKLSQKLSQTLVMTPQLQQAIKLLQLGRLDYQQILERELLENPILEDARDNDSDEPAPEQYPVQASNTQTSEDPHAPDNWPEHSPESNVYSQEFGGQEFGIGEAFNYGSGRSGGDGDRPSLEATLSSREGLTSHLLWQLRTTELENEDRDIAAQIVGNLDRNGYVGCTIWELAELTARPVEDVERVLSIVQSLDPPGIGARDLRECLLIQLDQQGLSGSLAWNIVSDHLAELELRHTDVIQKRLGCTQDEIFHALKIIQKLDPRPGRGYTEEEPIYITPDVYVRKVGEDYVVSLNDAGLPRLRLNQEYSDLLQCAERGATAERVYLQEKLRAASWLIKSMEQRQNTIFKVTESIMKFQREFLELGVSGLRPLVLREVALDVGMHESTISRVTSNKFVHTPQGVYELKFFFSSGLKSNAGNVSSESVKERIREFVASEDPKHPLSDQEIAEMLVKSGIDIARRTVAKYREMMSILSSSRRKKLF